MKTLRKIYYLKALSLSLGTLSSKISFYVCVMVYISLGNAITAEKAFVVLGFYHTLRSTLTIYIPLGISQLAELRASLTRIKQVLMADEASLDASTILEANENIMSAPCVLLDKATVMAGERIILHDISLKVEKGLIAITGSVGSGKSALLGLILKDLVPIKGTVDIQGTVSYASQEPWIFPGSIKQNILFGQPFNKERYYKVISVCCLRTDFNLLPKGDLTIAGDRGLNLSKGQQARINLARAVYKDCDIYLLDDCLSALDAHVSQQVFDECIQGLLKDKLCIMATHHIRHLEQANKIVLLNNGSVERIGHFKELEEAGTEFKNINVNESIETQDKRTSIFQNDDDMASEIDTLLKEKDIKLNGSSDITKKIKESISNEDNNLLTPLKEKTYSEDKEHGSVNLSIYKSYFSFGGGKLVILALLSMFIVAQGSLSYSDILIGKW